MSLERQRKNTKLRRLTNATRLNAAPEKLETFYEEKTKGIIIRARARWHEHGEKSTKYFFKNRQKKSYKKTYTKTSHKRSNKNRSILYIKGARRFHKNLYKSSTTDPDLAFKIYSFLNDLNIPTLSEDKKKICEGSILAEECFRLQDSFDNNKTPGNDGIPIEFYKTFWSVISDRFNI